MRLVSLDNISTGMHLARNVYGDAGQVLLKQGVEIKPHYIAYLKKIGINQVYIQDSRLGSVEGIEDVIAENTRVEAKMNLSSVFNNSMSKKSPQKVVVEKKLMQTTTSIIDQLLNNKEVVLQLAEIKTQDDYLVSHAVSVTAISTIILIKTGYPVSRLRKHIAGFLFLDVGSAKLPEYIFNKRESLTSEEEDIIRKHPELSYNIFKETSLYTKEAGEIIMQHHERAGGQGYPFGLKGDEITYLGRVAAVADVYDALISSRPYRPPMHPYKAIMFMQEQGFEYFDIDVLHCLFSFLAAFPVGSHVKLSNGDSGFVTGNTPGYTFYPRVKVLYKGDKMIHHPDPYEINLAEKFDVTVVGVIENE